MRFASLALAATFMLTGIGCHHNLAKNGDCQSCGGPHGGGDGLAGQGHGDGGGFAGNGHGGGNGGTRASNRGGRAPTPVGRLPRGHADDAGHHGPPSATYAYPYYTTRAPRDFLMNNPPTIGP